MLQMHEGAVMRLTLTMVNIVFRQGCDVGNICFFVGAVFDSRFLRYVRHFGCGKPRHRGGNLHRLAERSSSRGDQDFDPNDRWDGLGAEKAFYRRGWDGIPCLFVVCCITR